MRQSDNALVSIFKMKNALTKHRFLNVICFQKKANRRISAAYRSRFPNNEFRRFLSTEKSRGQ